MICESAVRIGFDEICDWEIGSGDGTVVFVTPVYEIGISLAKDREKVHVCVSGR